MQAFTVDPERLHAWLSARSIIRELPPPVPEHGGLRVDTGSEAEVVRWVFAAVGAGLVALAQTIHAPRHPLKVCAAPEALRAALPARWRLHAPSWFMTAGAAPREPPPLVGYTVESAEAGGVVAIRIRTAAGELAGSGHAVETRDAFVYDRIVTAPDHRRRGLGRVVMAALRRTKRRPGAPELLVATEDGRALYAALGWRTLSPYATASIPEA